MPNQQTGISQIKAPIIPNQFSGVPNPEAYQDFIATHNTHDIVWEKVLDQKKSKIVYSDIIGNHFGQRLYLRVDMASFTMRHPSSS
jgi:hypothetical protein